MCNFQNDRLIKIQTHCFQKTKKKKKKFSVVFFQSYCQIWIEAIYGSHCLKIFSNGWDYELWVWVFCVTVSNISSIMCVSAFFLWRKPNYPKEITCPALTSFIKYTSPPMRIKVASIPWVVFKPNYNTITATTAFITKG